MTEFQLILLVVAAYFGYKVFTYIQNFDEERSDGFADTADEPRNLFPDRTKTVQPDTAEMVKNADIAYESGDIATAQQLLEIALVHQPKSTEILNKLAFVEAKNGQVERAVENYNRSLSIDSGDDLVHNAVASLYKELEMFDKARSHYEKALEIDDNYTVTYYNYGNLLALMEEREGAKAMYQKAIDINGEFAEAAAALEALGR